jgi:hypothetical protein
MKAGLRRPFARPRSVRQRLVPTSRGRLGHGAARALALFRMGGGGAAPRPSGRAPLSHASLAFAADQAFGGGIGRAATRTRFARPGADLRGRDAARPCPPVPVRVQESQAQKHGYQHDRPPRGARPHLQASTSGIPRLSTPVSWDRSVLVRERAHRTARVEERETHKLTGRPARRCACPRSCSGQRL